MYGCALMASEEYIQNEEVKKEYLVQLIHLFSEKRWKL